MYCYFSTPVLNRCVPKPFQEVGDIILSNFYGLLNSWDTLEQILGDLYNTWKVILGLAVLSLGKYILFFIIQYLFYFSQKCIMLKT